jgi:hypothetical protein
MAYEKTEVPVAKSQHQIRQLIYSHKGKGLNLISMPPMEGFETMIAIVDCDYHVRIMAKCRKVVGNGKAQEQEERRVWRVLYYHLKAMFDSSDSGVIDIRDVILPYVVTKDGTTVADRLKPHMAKLMNNDPSRMLGSGE